VDDVCEKETGRAPLVKVDGSPVEFEAWGVGEVVSPD